VLTWPRLLRVTRSRCEFHTPAHWQLIECAEEAFVFYMVAYAALSTNFRVEDRQHYAKPRIKLTRYVKFGHRCNSSARRPSPPLLPAGRADSSPEKASLSSRGCPLACKVMQSLVRNLCKCYTCTDHVSHSVTCVLICRHGAHIRTFKYSHAQAHFFAAHPHANFRFAL